MKFQNSCFIGHEYLNTFCARDGIKILCDEEALRQEALSQNRISLQLNLLLNNKIKPRMDPFFKQVIE